MSRSRATRRPSVLIGFRETAGFCRNLRLGLEQAGGQATFVDLFDDPLRYGTAGTQRGMVRLIARLRRRRTSPGRLPAAIWVVLYRIAMTAFFLDALLRYDAFVFPGSNSFFGLRELPLLKRVGKRVINVYLGSDSRPSYLNGAELAASRGLSTAAIVAATRDKARLLRRVERHADWIVAHPPSSMLHRRPFIAFLALGLPYPTADLPPPHPPTDGPIIGLHAPSHPEAKGTKEIRRAVARLQASGVPIVLREIIGAPNAEVLRAIAESHFVIDELYSDSPMATFAAEAAALGRPAVVGGYGWDGLRVDTPPEMMPPSQLCRPGDLDGAIRQLVEDHAHREQLGAAARAFVRRQWAPAEVGRRYLQLLSGSFPPDWLVNPAESCHVTGTGLPAERARSAIRAVVSEFGPEALQLDGNPGCRDALLRFADETDEPD